MPEDSDASSAADGRDKATDDGALGAFTPLLFFTAVAAAAVLALIVAFFVVLGVVFGVGYLIDRLT